MDALHALRESAKLMKGRDEQYGRAYKKAGPIMKAFFPDGVRLVTEEDFARFMAFQNCVAKMNRYSENMGYGKAGHLDSADDLINYAAILRESTDE